jgi:type I restriction enzyme, S subunit
MRKREEYEMNEVGSWMESYPKSWELTSVRGITENINQKNTDSKNTNYLSLMANIGVILYADKGDVGNKLPDDLSKCKLVDIGDLVINSMNYGIGSYGISPYNGICSPVYLVLRSNKNLVLNEFAKRIFEIDKFQKHAQSFGTGILEHRRAINWDILKNIPVALPDLATQQRIANFLNTETGKIDNLVDELTKFKGQLQTQRKSLISECVTKGVPEDRDRAYKDSGVEWLGEIPVGWNISKLKNVFTERKEKSRENAVHLTPSQKYGTLPQSEYIKVSGSKPVLVLSENATFKQVYPNDFISHLRSFQGGLQFHLLMSNSVLLITWMLRPLRLIL